MNTAEEGLSLDIHYARGDFVIDTSFFVARGERVAVIGPNGAGKSTLLSIAAGLITPQNCTITCGNMVWSSPTTITPTRKRRVGLLAQNPGLFTHLTVLGNAAYGPRSRGVGKNGSDAIARDAVKKTGMAGFATRWPRELSGGEQQRVAIARLLASEPTVALLDEPLTGLDVAAAADVRRLLLDTWRPDVCGLIATHDPVDVLALTSRVIVLDNGRITADQTTHEAFSHPQTPFLARFAGLNLVGKDETTWLCFPPDAAALTQAASTGALAFDATTTATQADPNGAYLLVKIDGGHQLTSIKIDTGELALHVPGERVTVAVDPAKAVAYKKSTIVHSIIG